MLRARSTLAGMYVCDVAWLGLAWPRSGNGSGGEDTQHVLYKFNCECNWQINWLHNNSTH